MTDKDMPANDPYDILGVPPTATEAAIQKAYRRKALQLHPDKQAGLSEAAQRQAAKDFEALQQAREFLLHQPEARRAYDAKRASKLARQKADEAREKGLSEKRKKMREELAQREADAKQSRKRSRNVDSLRKQGQQMQQEYAQKEAMEAHKRRQQAKERLEDRQIKVKWSRRKIGISPSEHSLAELLGTYGVVESVEMTGSKGHTAMITFADPTSCAAAVDAYADSEEMRASFVGKRKEAATTRQVMDDEPPISLDKGNDPDWRLRREAERERILREMEAEESGKPRDDTKKGSSFPLPFSKDLQRGLSPLEKLNQAEHEILGNLFSTEKLKSLRAAAATDVTERETSQS